MGAQQVKNIDEPISVYRLVPAPISVNQKAKKPATEKRTKSEKKRRRFRIPAKKTLAFGIVVGAVFIWYDSSSLPSVKEACNQIQMVEFKIREYGSPTSLASRALQQEQQGSWRFRFQKLWAKAQKEFCY